MNDLRIPTLLFQLGRLQVFHYPTPEQLTKNEAPKEVFWQDTLSRNTYGPFPSINEAMNHYTWTVANQKTETKLGKVIYVDFFNKKVIDYQLPKGSDNGKV